MADIVPSLFGVTPQMYQQQQQDRMDAQALRFAQLDPFQQAQFSISRGANMLGGAIGGALGGQDPELQRITMRQQIAGQLNPNDPTSIQQAISALQQAGDTEGAMMLQGEFRKLQESGALIEQRKAAAAASTAAAGRERAPPTTSELTNARAIAAAAGPEGSPEYNAAFKKEYERLTAPKDSKEPTTTELTNARAIAAQAGPVGSPEYNAAFAAEYTRLTAPKEPKGPSFGTDREAVAAEVYGKPFADLTQPQKAAVNKRVEEESRAKTPSQTFVLPGDKALVDIPGFRSKVQDTIKPQSQAVFAADNALTNIQDSISTGNFASYRAAQVQFAKAIAGAGDLSQKELQAAGADPSLLGGTADYLSRLFTSTPTLDTQNKMKRTLEAIKKVSTDKANAEIERQRKIALRNKAYDSDAVNAALDFPEFRAAPAAAGGGTLAEQAAAELKRRQSKGK